MIPDISVPVYHLGPIPIDPWGTLVCIGFVLGLEVARARALRLGLDIRDIVDGTVATVLVGFVGGHLFHVLAYHPEKLQTEGITSLLEIWAGFSSFGGFMGATIGSVLFFKFLRPRPYWKHADVVMFGFPFGWIFGRLGCFLAKDHIGRQTTFFLAQKMQFQLENRSVIEIRHNLGLYEALYTMGIAAVFLLADRRPRKDGFFLALWCMLYAPARFGFDFLRNTDLNTADVRWGGLTPAQWGCIGMFGLGVWLVARLKDGGTPEAPKAPEKKEPVAPTPYNRTERRNWFRIPAPGGCQVILYERGEDGQELVRVAPLVDLSAGGIAIRLADDGVDPGDLAVGSRIERLELRLFGAEPMSCAGVVRNLRPLADPDDPALLCGIEFLAVAAPMRTALIHYVMRRERSMLQHRRAVRARTVESEPIRLTLLGDSPVVFRVRDLSATGAAVMTESPVLWPDGTLQFQLELPNEPVITLVAQVVRSEQRPPFLLYGLAFREVLETDTQRIESWVRRHAAPDQERPHG